MNEDKYTALNDTHRFYVSDRNIILERYVAPRQKTAKVNGAVPVNEFTKEYWECLGYYRTHAQMLKAFVGSEMRQCDQGIYDLIDKCDELQRTIERIGGFDENQS